MSFGVYTGKYVLLKIFMFLFMFDCNLAAYVGSPPVHP